VLNAPPLRPAAETGQTGITGEVVAPVPGEITFIDHTLPGPDSAIPPASPTAAPLHKMRRRLQWRVSVAAAAVAALAGLSLWLMVTNSSRSATVNATTASSTSSTPVLPGGDRAFLTLANGSIVALDSLQNGALPEPGAQVARQGGVLVYHPTSAEAGAPAYNTLSTPRGGQFSIVLPDGSRVWLNASSSLYYPTVFAGEEREVVLKGEAYFEIAHRQRQPFIVTVGDMRVEVLGTHFNINAYEDESQVRTSLLEGSVKLKSGQAGGLLLPGQQASLSRESGELTIRETSMGQAVAWKNGLFQFEQAGIQEIMRQISRWYNVEVGYVGKPTGRMFDGKIRRSAELSKVLKILELSGVKFTVKGNHVTVH